MEFLGISPCVMPMSEEKFTETVERAIDNLRTINTISPDEFPAMDLYMELLALKEPPMRILFLLARQFRQLKQHRHAGV